MAHSELASPSATRDVLAAFGLFQKKSFGQHFLIDDNIVGRILDLASLDPDDVVLEIGPGIGTLTVALCRAAGSVVAEERDEALLPVLRRTTSDCPAFAVICADAVRVSAQEMVAPFGAPDAVVANLPYEVAATVALRVFEVLPSLASATVMVQAEVADRMMAAPGGKDYGAYTVKLALKARAVGRFNVPRSAFMPVPRVDSTVVRLERREWDETPEALAAASEAARAAFVERRKTIRNSLASGLPCDRDSAERSLRQAGVDPDRRAETLSVEEYVGLGRILLKNRLLP
jgi:16S rRNA (adenine1518-N6/adenine1519-N6)-dimethyltransferase